MTAYKLLRRRRDGTLGALFVGRDIVMPLGERLTARPDLPHPGLAHRPGFHCTAIPFAPHIAMRLANGEERVWCRTWIEGFKEHKRPLSQGGVWYTAEHMYLQSVFEDGIPEAFLAALFIAKYGLPEYRKRAGRYGLPEFAKWQAGYSKSPDRETKNQTKQTRKTK